MLGGRPLGEAVEAYLRTVAVVWRKALSEAVADFVASRAPKAEAKDGKRPTLNPKYVENTASWLTKFAATFPGNDVGDLSKDHLNAYIAAFSELSAKSRNDRRAVVKQFLKWCVRNDYLIATHRLLEADGLTAEDLDAAPTDYYRPRELRALLDKAKGQMRAVIALQELAGLRLEEALRLDWREVFGVPGHIEVTSAKSKSRQRRLVEMCPALKQWLAPYRGMKGKLATQWQGGNGWSRRWQRGAGRRRVKSFQRALRGSSSPNNHAMAGCQRNGLGSGGRGGSVSNVSSNGRTLGYSAAAADKARTSRA